MSGFHSLSSQSPGVHMEKHRFGNAKVFYDKDGRIYYQGQQNGAHRDDRPSPPAHSEPLPDSRDYRSYDAERDKKRKYQYEESFRSLDHNLDINEYRQKGYQVVKEERYDPYTGKPMHSLDRGHRREPSPDRRYNRDPSPSRSPEKRPLPVPPGPTHLNHQYHDQGAWQRSFDRHPLVDERYGNKGAGNTGYKCLGIFYILVALLLTGVGIVNVLLCTEHLYYFHFWVGFLVLIAGIFGLVHSGDYGEAWKTWFYVVFAVLGAVAGTVGYGFLAWYLIPQTQVLGLLDNVSDYATLAKPQDPHVTVSDTAVTWVCYSMHWLTLLLLLMTFTLMSSAVVIFNKFWAKNYTSTNEVEPFCIPALFNPWGQVQLGQAMVFFGIITVYACTAESGDTLWAKYWSPVWCGGLTVIAGWVSGITGKREDNTGAALGSVILQTLSLCTSVTSIVLCTLGLVDNINTAQDMDNDSTLLVPDLRNLTIGSAVMYSLMDAVLLVNVFYTIGGMVRHLSTFCNGIRSREKKRLSYGDSVSSHSGYPGRHGNQQYQDRRPRYNGYPSQDRNMGNGYHHQRY